jgi:hypothetical protein
MAGYAPTCPHCLEPVDEDASGADAPVEGPRGNLWHQRCLDSWREDEPGRN